MDEPNPFSDIASTSQTTKEESLDQESPENPVQPVTRPAPSQVPFRLRDDPDSSAKIQIIDAVKTNEGGTSSYISYLIRSSFGDARRRYSEFEQLRSVLAKLHPVLIIPPIPPHHSIADYAVKQSKAKEDASVIARRRRMLSVFLNRLNRHPILSQDRVLQRFLDPNVTWAEILHAPPVTLLPKNVLRAPAKDPTDTSRAEMYNALPLPSGQALQEPVQRFVDSETFTNKFSAHMSGTLEKVNRRLMKRWTDLGSDEADLGGLLNGFGLLEQSANPDLAQAIEKVGQAIDSTYVHTNVMLQEWERSYTEPLAEYTQFSAIIKQLLKFRHNKQLQYEMTKEVLDGKRAQLQDLERSEAEAKRLDQALDQALNGVKPLDASGNVESLAASASAHNQAPVTQTATDLSASAMRASGSKTGSPSIGFFNALSHSISNVMDADPESTRRSNIGKTRELLGHLEEGVLATEADVTFASMTVQADLDRFQRQKVADIKDMSLSFAAFHKEWCEKNLQQWLDAKQEIENISIT